MTEQLFLIAAPKALPIASARGVRNPDGSITVVDGGLHLVAAASLDRKVKVEEIDGSTVLETSDIPHKNPLTAAEIAERINAAVIADTSRGGQSFNSYGAFVVEKLTGNLAKTSALRGGPGANPHTRPID